MYCAFIKGESVRFGHYTNFTRKIRWQTSFTPRYMLHFEKRSMGKSSMNNIKIWPIIILGIQKY